jgi:hypothetical protein
MFLDYTAYRSCYDVLNEDRVISTMEIKIRNHTSGHQHLATSISHICCTYLPWWPVVIIFHERQPNIAWELMSSIETLGSIFFLTTGDHVLVPLLLAVPTVQPTRLILKLGLPSVALATTKATLQV